MAHSCERLLATSKFALRCAAFLASIAIVIPQVAHAADPTQPLAGERVLSFYMAGETDIVAVTNEGAKGFIEPFPSGIARFDEPALNTSIAMIVKLHDADGKTVGFASQMEYFTGNADEVATSWTVVIPGRGALYLTERERPDPRFHVDIVQKVFKTGTPWDGTFHRLATSGPRPDGRGEISGGSMEFANAKGSFVEMHTYTRFTPDGKVGGNSELRIFLK